MSYDHLNKVLVSLVFAEIFKLLFGLFSDVAGPLGELGGVVLCILKFFSKYLLNLFFGLCRAELVLKGGTDLVGLVTLRDLFTHLYIIFKLYSPE